MFDGYINFGEIDDIATYKYKQIYYCIISITMFDSKNIFPQFKNRVNQKILYLYDINFTCIHTYMYSVFSYSN